MGGNLHNSTRLQLSSGRDTFELFLNELNPMADAKVTVATELPQQALEVAYALSAAETAGLALATPDITARRVSITPNLTAGTVSITMTLPIVTSGDTDGGVSFDAVDYLPNVA